MKKPSSYVIPIAVFVICVTIFAFSERSGAIVLTVFSLIGFVFFAFGFARINRSNAMHVAKALIAFSLLGLSFGGVYSAFGTDLFPNAKSSFDYYYYSFLTMTTLGYADVAQNQASVLGKTLIVSQCMISIMFGFLVLGTLFSNKEN